MRVWDFQSSFRKTLSLATVVVGLICLAGANSLSDQKSPRCQRALLFQEGQSISGVLQHPTLRRLARRAGAQRMADELYEIIKDVRADLEYDSVVVSPVMMVDGVRLTGVGGPRLNDFFARCGFAVYEDLIYVHVPMASLLGNSLTRIARGERGSHGIAVQFLGFIHAWGVALQRWREAREAEGITDLHTRPIEIVADDIRNQDLAQFLLRNGFRVIETNRSGTKIRKMELGLRFEADPKSNANAGDDASLNAQ